MKIIIYLVTALITLAATVAGFFVLLLGLNGYSERQATPSLILYLVASLLTVLGFGALAAFSANLLVKKNWGTGPAVLIATISSSIVAGVVLIAGLFAAFALAEVLRGMR
jgi:hypothetical protein